MYELPPDVAQFVGLPSASPWAVVTVKRETESTVGMWYRDFRGKSHESTATLDGWRWPARWSAYEVELFGALRELDRLSPGWSYLAFTPEGRQPCLGDRVMHLRYQQATLPGAQCVSYIRWEGDDGDQGGITDPGEQRITREDLWAAHTGLLLLRQLVPHLGGPRKGVTALGDMDETRAALLRTGRAIMAKRKRKPKEPELAKMLDSDSRQLRRWIKAAGFRDFEDYLHLLDP